MAPDGGGCHRRAAWMAAGVFVPALVVLTTLAATAAVLAQDGGKCPAAPALGDPHDPVVGAALGLIADRYPSPAHIYVTDPRDLKVVLPSGNTPAFRIYYGNWVDPSIFVNQRSELYRLASEGNGCALKLLAAALTHEMVHSRTKDDREASRVELDVLDGFLKSTPHGVAEHLCLMERQQAIRAYSGLQ